MESENRNEVLAPASTAGDAGAATFHDNATDALITFDDGSDTNEQVELNNSNSNLVDLYSNHESDDEYDDYTDTTESSVIEADEHLSWSLFSTTVVADDDWQGSGDNNNDDREERSEEQGTINEVDDLNDNTTAGVSVVPPSHAPPSPPGEVDFTEGCSLLDDDGSTSIISSHGNILREEGRQFMCKYCAVVSVVLFINTNNLLHEQRSVALEQKFIIFVVSRLLSWLRFVCLFF